MTTDFIELPIKGEIPQNRKFTTLEKEGQIFAALSTPGHGWIYSQNGDLVHEIQSNFDPFEYLLDPFFDPLRPIPIIDFAQYGYKILEGNYRPVSVY